MSENKAMEIYYATVNILDYMALNELDKVRISKFLRELDVLAGELVRIGEDESVQKIIESIADANDAGGCTTWLEIVEDFKEQFENGNRVKVKEEEMKGFSIRRLATYNVECRGSMYLEIVKIAACTLASPDKLRDFSIVIWSVIYDKLTEMTPLYVGISEVGYTINIGNFDKKNNITDTRWFIIKIDSNDYVYADEIAITKINHPYTEKKLISYFCKVLMGIEDIKDLVTNVDCVIEESNNLIIKYMNGTMTKLQITNLDKEI